MNNAFNNEPHHRTLNRGGPGKKGIQMKELNGVGKKGKINEKKLKKNERERQETQPNGEGD